MSKEGYSRGRDPLNLSVWGMTSIVTTVQVSGPLGEVTVVVEGSAQAVFVGEILLYITPMFLLNVIVIGHHHECLSKVTVLVDTP